MPAAAPASASIMEKRASRDGRLEASNRLRIPIAAACCVTVAQRR